jgi:hypothetical protein
VSDALRHLKCIPVHGPKPGAVTMALPKDVTFTAGTSSAVAGAPGSIALDVVEADGALGDGGGGGGSGRVSALIDVSMEAEEEEVMGEEEGDGILPTTVSFELLKKLGVKRVSQLAPLLRDVEQVGAPQLARSPLRVSTANLPANFLRTFLPSRGSPSCPLTPPTFLAPVTPPPSHSCIPFSWLVCVCVHVCVRA